MLEKKLIIPKDIICADEKNSILKNHSVEITGSRISAIRQFNESEIKNFNGSVHEFTDLTLIPGFIQTHVHLCQTLFRGMAEELPLLEWLKYKIFPFENAHSKESLGISARLGINELLLGGTTTVLDMGTLRYQEVVFEELINSGIRAFSGKCMIDKNDLLPEFKAKTKDEINESLQLAKNFHKTYDGRTNYAFAPRFVLSCSEQLQKETKEIMKDFPGSLYHTHSSENKNETREVRKKFNKENIEYFDSIDVLDDHTILAHCVHLNDNEIKILKRRKTRVAHCPSANLKLGSGIAPIPKFLKAGILVSLGSDGAPCNNNLSMFSEMRLASLIQKPTYGSEAMDAKTVFRLATIEGAKALHIHNETGSIETGKKADLVLIDLNAPTNSLSDDEKDIYSDIVFASSSENISEVMIDGNWLVRKGKSVIYDQKELVGVGKRELKKLLGTL
ncbi:MAG TPA: amidohydrolase family protein [Ignavibacteriaceae bacterium]|nr:amidohydrolase family protein [Ignavibacteriaceae bacterium]